MKSGADYVTCTAFFISTACLTATDEGYTFDLLGHEANSDGITALWYSVTNAGKHSISHVAFGIPDGWEAVGPTKDDNYTGALGDYNVVWTNENGNPGFPSIKFETGFEGFGDGASDVFAVVVSGFDDAAMVQVAGKAGQVRGLVALDLGDVNCVIASSNGTPTPIPPNSPLATPTPTQVIITPPPTVTPTPLPEALTTALNYVAQQHNLPLDKLVIAAPFRNTYPHINREFTNVAIVDTRGGGRTYRVLVDPVTLEVESDLGAIQRANEEAYIARYGKMELALYERLQAASPDELISVAFWVNGSGGGQAALYDQVAALFPEAQAALDLSRKPWDVADETLATQIRQAYRQIAQENTQQRLAPLVDYIWQQYGLFARTHDPIPSISITLTKAQVEDIVQHPRVAMGYLAEGVAVEEQTFSNGVDGNSVNVTDIWNITDTTRIDGSGVTVTILEDRKISDRTTCFNVIGRYSITNTFDSHKSRVASILACNDPNYPGMAQGVTLLDANYVASHEISKTHRIIDTLQWAITYTPKVYLVNASFGLTSTDTTSTTIQWLDRAVDYWTRHQDVLLVKSAGNQGNRTNWPDQITSPGRAWNVLTVGASDLNTEDIADYSSWFNPVVAGAVDSDREKPELVAPGGPFVMYELNNTLVPITQTKKGTSYAAPQVTGLAAMMLQKQPELEGYPEAVRAILLASATKNITGTRGIPRNNLQPVGDLKDGAGQIDAAQVIKIAGNFSSTDDDASCGDACWWYQTTNRGGGGTIRYFTGKKGFRIRVAISWWSQADSDSNDYSFDRLDTDFDLRVEHESSPGSWEMVSGLASSNSRYNNYELLDVLLFKDGRHRIIIPQTVYNNEDSNVVGIAMTMLHQEIYLPTIHIGLKE